jgi:transketolase
VKPVNEDIKIMKENILKISHIAQEGHIASAFSILDVLWYLYDEVMKEDDLFILSKGHASLALYAVLCQKKLIKLEDFITFGSFDSDFGGHPDRNKIPHVIASTGSLGHGLPIAVGMALAKKIKNESGRVFCLIGDGEANEGSIWESALLAKQHELNNLIIIVDYNHSTDRSINLGELYNIFSEFGLSCCDIDGHEKGEIIQALDVDGFFWNCPTGIIANTIKGNGCKTMENNPEWHHKSPNLEQLNLLLEELDDA